MIQRLPEHPHWPLVASREPKVPASDDRLTPTAFTPVEPMTLQFGSRRDFDGDQGEKKKK